MMKSIRGEHMTELDIVFDCLGGSCRFDEAKYVFYE